MAAKSPSTAAKSKTAAAKKKTAAKGKATSRTTKKNDIKYVGNKAKGKSPVDAANRQYIYMITFIAAAILFSCIAIFPGENLWAYIRGAAFAVFGVGFFVLTAFCLAMAVIVSVKKLAKSPVALVIAALTLTVLIVSLIHALVYNSTDIPGVAGWTAQLKQCAKIGWYVSSEGIKISGGLLGAFFGGGMLFCFGKVPAVAIIILLMFVNILLIGVIVMDMFGLSVRQVLTETGEQRKERSQQRKEDRLFRKQEQEQEKRRLAQERLQKERERELQQRERGYYSLDEIDASLFKDTNWQPQNETNEEPKDKKTGYRRPILTIPLEFAAENAADGEADAVSQNQTELEPLSVPAESIAEVSKAVPADNNSSFDELFRAPTPAQPAVSDSDDVVSSAANEAKSKTEQTKAALDSYTDDKVKARKRMTYHLPPIECLAAPKFSGNEDYTAEMRSTSQKLLDTLRSFNVETTLVGVCRGPSVTRYELTPAPGVKISKITNLADDIALSLAASGVRIEAPIPNKPAVGIEVPNKARATVTLREIIVSKEFRSAAGKLNVALGKDITGNVNCADLAKMPHLLIAGTTGSGKSVCLNCMIASILYNARPDEVKMILIDPKQVEFSVYNGIPHLLVPVISNPRKASGALAWAVAEMENRYKAFSECGVRDIKGFNKYCQTHPELAPMPLIVIFIDELNDLMMISPKEVEDSICRLAQKARAAGMHLVVATQRPSVDVITGIIKANIPSRISLSVSSQVDSRTILDAIGAEKLLGNGDMLFNPVGISKPVRIQGAFLSDDEVEKIVDYIKQQETGEYDEEIMEEIERQAAAEKKKTSAAVAAVDDVPQGDSDLIAAAIEVVVNAQIASTTLLQRKLKLGYARAARIMDELNEKGYVGPSEGSKPRKVLITPQQWMEIKASSSGASDNDVYSDE